MKKFVGFCFEQKGGLLNIHRSMKTGFQSLPREYDPSIILSRMSKARGIVYSIEEIGVQYFDLGAWEEGLGIWGRILFAELFQSTERNYSKVRV